MPRAATPTTSTRRPAVALDWVRHNPIGDDDTPEEAWTDKVVGDRTPYLAYMLRAAACEGLLTPREERELLDSLMQHGRVLASKRNYTRDNHGLFADLGPRPADRVRAVLRPGRAWRALARERFETTLRRRLSQGVWLEHSSAYQFLAIRPLDSMLAVLGPDPELTDLRDRMRTAAAWFVKPDGRDDPVRRLEPRAGARLGAGARVGDRDVLRRRLRLRPRAGAPTATSATSRSPTAFTTSPTSTPTSSASSSSTTARASSATPGSTTRTRARSATTWSPTAPTAGSSSTDSTCRSPTRRSPTDPGSIAAGERRRLVRDRGPQPRSCAARASRTRGSSSTAPGPRW